MVNFKNYKERGRDFQGVEAPLFLEQLSLTNHKGVIEFELHNDEVSK